MTSRVDHGNAATSQSNICFLSSLWLTYLEKSKLRAVLIDGNNSWTALPVGHGKSVKVMEKSHGKSWNFRKSKAYEPWAYNTQHCWAQHVASVCLEPQQCWHLFAIVAYSSKPVKLLGPCRRTQHCWLNTPQQLSRCFRLHGPFSQVKLVLTL